MKYICETCNNQYDTADLAEQCELTHKKKEADDNLRQLADSKIADAVNAYIAKYKKMPSVKISPENEEILYGSAISHAEALLDRLIDLFAGDCDCDDEYEDDEEK